MQNEEDLAAALDELGDDTILKTTRFGYDGKGQWRASRFSREELVKELDGREAVLEARVPFQRELSVIAVRSKAGEIAVYPLVETHHHEGILRYTLAPALNVSEEKVSQAKSFATKILERFDYAGVLALELFDTEEGLLANEIAPRVHNSGHWTQDGAVTSQFENHVRAVCGLPLGSCEAIDRTLMINLIGEHPPLQTMLSRTDAKLHLYDKEPRPGRKIGHVNFVLGSAEPTELLCDYSIPEC